MDFGKKLKNLIKFERRAHTKTDWLGLAVFVSLAVFAGFLLLEQLISFAADIEMQNHRNRIASQEMIFQQNANNPENTPHRTYEQARQALLDNDLEGVLATIHPSAVWKYEDNLRAAYEDGNLPELTKPMTPLKSVVTGDLNDSEIGATVVYSVEPIPGNNNADPLDNYGEIVEFIRDEKGIWKISSI